VWAMKLAESGYGSYEEVKKFDVGTFMLLIHRVNYLAKYNNVMSELNRKK
jgi:hypothetical protein